MASNLERFEVLCASLRRNNPKTTELDTNHFPVGYGRRLGDALERNSHVSSMTLWLHHVLAADESVDSAARLLRYIRESASMRKIQLDCEIDPPCPAVAATLLRLALRAIADSANIEELSLWMVLPPDAIALLLKTTQSIKTLSILFDEIDGVASRELVAEALGANRTLECLALEEFQDGFSTNTVESVLLHLGSNPGLHVLKLNCGASATMAQLRAFVHFMRTTISLENLHLCHYDFDKERMEQFVEGLQSSRSLAKLTVDLCEFDLEATKLFHNCMQAVETMSSIRELCFHDSEGMFAGSTAGRVAAAFLTVPENRHMGSCIASSLQVLNFNDDSAECDLAGFCDTLAANAYRIRLPCVHNFSISDSASWEALVRCLPKLVYLRELHIPFVDPQEEEDSMDIVARSFVDAMCKNGSLRVVEIGTGNRDGNFFDEAESRLIRSCCKRNEALPTLVTKPRPDETAIALFPKLFVAAKQARRTAPNAILLGLLTAGDDVGPRQCRKRPRKGPSA